MRILRKMDNRNGALSKLTSLENPDIGCTVIYVDRWDDYKAFSVDELKKLITQSAGPDVTKLFDKDALMRVLHAMVQTMDVTVVANAFELDLQLRSVPEDDIQPYVYVPGAQRPALRHTPAPTLLAKAAGSAAALAKEGVQGQVAGTTSNALPGAVVEAFVMPKEGTSTHTIFMFCAQAWKDASFKDDKDTWDRIRKSAIDKLTKDGLNISTIRVQSARWYQHRQRLVA